MKDRQWGGSENLWHSLALHALANGNEVLISIYKWETLHDKIQQLKSKGAVIHLRNRFVGEKKLLKRAMRLMANTKFAMGKDYKSIFNFKPDILFISQGADFDFAVQHKILYKLIVKNNLPYSFICHSHSQYSLIPDENIYPKAIEVFKNAGHVFFISKKQHLLTERKLVTKLENARFTWNPLNIDLPEEPLPWPSDETINFAIVGVLEGSKGQDTCFEVLSDSKWKDRSWQLNLYGDGNGKKYLEDLAKYYSIDDKIVFHGHEKKILKIWMKNHILLIPSSWEGMPISLVEAMSCGRPAIAANIGGVKELVSDEKDGFISSSPDSEAFGAAMEKAWKLKSTWEEVGHNSFNKIKEVFDPAPEKKIYVLICELLKG